MRRVATRFTTIKPGPYPWGNHYNAWRPAHIHFSLLGRAFTQRLVTQMYFPGDPLFPYDPIFNSVRDEAARERMISALLDPRHPARLGARLRVRHLPARPGRDAVRGGAVIFGRPHRRPSARTSRSACPGRKGRRPSRRVRPARSDPRRGLRRRRRADPRLPARDLAGRSRRPLRRPLGLRRALGARRASAASRASAHEDGDGSFELVTVKPGPAAAARRPRRRRRTSTCRCSRAGCCTAA